MKFALIAAAILTLLSIPIWFYDPYYYVLLRLAVCFLEAYCAYLLKLQKRRLFWVLILIAFLFNPIFLLALLGRVFAPIDLLIVLFLLWIAKQPQIDLAALHQESNNPLRRILIAGCASLVIVFAMADNIRFVTSENDITTYDRFIHYLWIPADSFWGWITAGKIDALSYLFELLGISMLIYALVIWGILLLEAWIRTGKMR